MCRALVVDSKNEVSIFVDQYELSEKFECLQVLSTLSFTQLCHSMFPSGRLGLLDAHMPRLHGLGCARRRRCMSGVR